MQLAGKYAMGVLSIASTSQEGLQALPTQWSFAEEAAKKHDQKVDRKNWRVVMAWHLAESKKQAEQEAVDGLQHWHNEYNVRVLGRPGSIHVADKWELLARTTGIGNAVGTSVIGTPDEMVKTIRALQEVTGGFGVVLGFAHDWANHEATLRSWELFARYVIPEINGHTRNLKASAEYLAANKVELMTGLNAAIMAKVQGNKVAEAAMAVTRERMATQAQGDGWRPESDTPATDPGKAAK
jgi:limonene 1,2-monooxygenase